MRKKIDPFFTKKSYEEKVIWQTSQKFTISSTFSEEFSRCTIKGYEEKNTSYPFFLFKGIKHIIAKNAPLRCVRSLVAP
jgi:hypothetical protein